MSSIDLFRMALSNLWRRKLRTILTVLGVIIGTTSIIVMLSLGFGLRQSFQTEMEQWGDLTTINVYKGWVDPSLPSTGQREAKLDDEAVNSFKLIPNVVAVSPTISSYGTVIDGRYISGVNIQGIDPGSMEAFGFEAVEGRVLNSSDDLAVVFGGSISRSFHDPKARGMWREPKIDLMKDRLSLTLDPNYGWDQPGGDKINYKEYKIKAVGILPEDDYETNWSIYMPMKTLQNLMKEKEKAEGQIPSPGSSSAEYQNINVKVNEMKNVSDVQQLITDMGHEAWSLNDQLESMQQIASTIQAVLGGIGAISLIVAAIGITNTMIMSIYERTKEIGVMKVIGASINDIKRLFLLESALIGLSGGIFGIINSYIFSFIINQFAPSLGNFIGGGAVTKISIIPISLTFAALAFSTLVGILSGYYPARRAMNLSALDAIRSE